MPVANHWHVLTHGNTGVAAAGISAAHLGLEQTLHVVLLPDTLVIHISFHMAYCCAHSICTI